MWSPLPFGTSAKSVSMKEDSGKYPTIQLLTIQLLLGNYSKCLWDCRYSSLLYSCCKKFFSSSNCKHTGEGGIWGYKLFLPQSCYNHVQVWIVTNLTQSKILLTECSRQKRTKLQKSAPSWIKQRCNSSHSLLWVRCVWYQCWESECGTNCLKRKTWEKPEKSYF